MKLDLKDLPGAHYALHAQVANLGFGMALDEVIAALHPLVGDEALATIKRRSIERLKNITLEGASIDLDAEIIRFAINVVEFALDKSIKRAGGQGDEASTQNE